MLLYFSRGFCRFGVSKTGSRSENRLEMTVWGFLFYYFKPGATTFPIECQAVPQVVFSAASGSAVLR